MSLSVLIFVNLSRQDAHIWALEHDGSTQFVAKLNSGDTLRHLSAVGQKWSIVTGDNYELAAAEQNQVFLIGSSGVYLVDHTRAIAAESGAIPADFDFPGVGGGGWP